MGTVFRFKQFEVDQRDCAMKINTDGVLIGALAEVILPERILDIGTGTGVIALMLAQRFSQAMIDAVEIDERAIARAIENFRTSAFNDRLVGHSGSFESLDGKYSYDLIVSNPPFYTNSLHNPDDRKKLARHTDFYFFIKLLDFAERNLSTGGTVCLIVPPDLAEEIKLNWKKRGYFLRDEIVITSFEDSDVIRKIISLQKQGVSQSILSKFIIYEERGVYSKSYKSLLKPFFLAF